MSEDISAKQMKFSDYLFLVDKLDDIIMIDSFNYFKQGYSMLDKIRAEEDYLFFKMKETVDSELTYYSENLKELDDIIEILDEEYAISSYHHIIKSIIDTKFYINEGNNLEFCLLESHRKNAEGKMEKVKAIYTLPVGTFEELNNMKKKSNKPKEGMYI